MIDTVITIVSVGLAFFFLTLYLRSVQNREETARFIFDELPERFQFDLMTQVREVYHVLGAHSVLPDSLETLTGSWVWIYRRNEFERHWLPALLIRRPKWVLDAISNDQSPIVLELILEDGVIFTKYFSLVSPEWTTTIQECGNMDMRSSTSPDRCQLHHRTSDDVVTYKFKDENMDQKVQELLVFAEDNYYRRPDEMLEGVLLVFDLDIDKNPEYSWVPNVPEASRRAYARKDLLVVLNEAPTTDEILNLIGYKKELSIPKMDAPTTETAVESEEARGPN